MNTTYQNESLLKYQAALGAVAAITQLGLSSGELSSHRARKVYGAFFTEAEKSGKITPVRYGARTKWYSVADILALKISDLQSLNKHLLNE